MSLNPRIIASVGMGCTTVGLLMLLVTLPDLPILYIIGGLAVLGLGYGLVSSPNTNEIMSSVGPDDLGMASGMFSTVRSIGQLVSQAVAMMVFSLIIGSAQITPAVYEELEWSYDGDIGCVYCARVPTPAPLQQMHPILYNP